MKRKKNNISYLKKPLKENVNILLIINEIQDKLKRDNNGKKYIQ